MPPEILFREDQQFRQPILWIILLCMSAFCVGTIAWMVSRQVIQDIPFGDDAMSNDQMVILGAIIVALNAILLLLFHALKLQTEVTAQGLFIRFKPFHRKTRKIDLSEVSSVASVKYRPAMEYGGWGIRRGRHGTAYNVSGDLGVRIDYENGYHLLIGTRHPAELKTAIDRCMAAR